MQPACCKDLLAAEETLAAELLEASLAELESAAAAALQALPAATATAALIAGGGSAASAGAELGRLFPGASCISICCADRACSGRLTLTLGGGTRTVQCCTCRVPALARLAAGGLCACHVDGCQPGQQVVGSFVLLLGRELAQRYKEQHEVGHGGGHVWETLSLCTSCVSKQAGWRGEGRME